MLYRNQLRAIYGGADVTGQILSVAQDPLAFALATGQYLYLGYWQKFAGRYFYFATPNVNAATVKVEFWNGTTWQVVLDMNDDTLGFTRSGWLSWTNDGKDWQQSTQAPISDVTTLYWVRVSANANLSALTSLQAILNLFCDDRTMRDWYPDLVADTRYVPKGQTNFYPQYQAGANLVLEELYRQNLIKHESQVLDVREVQIAACHAACYCILNGVPGATETLQKRADRAMDQMRFWLEKTRSSFDVDDSGEIDEDLEGDQGPVYIPRGCY